MVSVIMPAYKAYSTIGESIESVLAQTYIDWELLVICEDKESSEAAKQYDDARIRILQNDQRLGVAKARNRGVAESNGDWLAFLDADDIWRVDKLEKQLALGADISFTASAFIGYNYIMRVPSQLTYNELLKRNLMSCSSVMVKREAMGSFPEVDRPIHEDYVMWMKIVKTIGFACGIDEPMLWYRLNGDSKSSSRIRSTVMIYSAYRYVGYSVLSSVVMTVRYAVWSINKRRMIYES